MKKHEFNESLSFGQTGENLVIPILKKHIHLSIVKNNPKKQRKGIDIIPTIAGIPIGPIEVKIRENLITKYWKEEPDFFIETISVDTNNTPGWIYTGQAQILAYAVLDKSNKNIQHLWIFNFKQLQEWFKSQDLEQYQHRFAQNRNYKTWGRIIPKSALPINIFTQLL